MVCYIYDERELNVDDSTYVALSFDSADTELIRLSDRIFDW